MKITVCDVGPRDGLQNEAKSLLPETRAELVNRLAAAGLPRVEAVSFVSAERVPQMAGAEEVVEGIVRRDGTLYAGLALNEKGYDRLRAAGLDEVRFAVAATESFSKRNANASIEEAVSAAETPKAAARPPYWMAKTPAGRRRQWHRYQQAQDRLNQLLTHHAQRETHKSKKKRRSADQVRISPSEPEAALGRDKLKTFRPLDDVHLASDLDTTLILDYQVHATTTDAACSSPQWRRSRRRWATSPSEPSWTASMRPQLIWLMAPTME